MTLQLLIDTNLLLLFVVGSTSKKYIEKHKRLHPTYSLEDYELLHKVVSNATSVFVTPHTLTETSNLVKRIADPARTEIYRRLQALAIHTEEMHVPSKTAACRSEFIRLGLADSALIQLASDKITLLTTDLNLYLAVLKNGGKAINFNHVRDASFSS
jgi:hypothetical protein